MKKNMLLSAIVVLSFLAVQVYAIHPDLPATPAKLIIAFSSKAYWDGPTQSCLPRDKGCCFHIGFSLNAVTNGQIAGEMTWSAATGAVYAFNVRTGITNDTYNELCKTGKFYLDGPGTFSEEVIRMLKLPANYTIAAGYYPIRIEGDMAYVTFK